MEIEEEEEEEEEEGGVIEGSGGFSVGTFLPPPPPTHPPTHPLHPGPLDTASLLLQVGRQELRPGLVLGNDYQVGWVGGLVGWVGNLPFSIYRLIHPPTHPYRSSHPPSSPSFRAGMEETDPLSKDRLSAAQTGGLS